MAANKQQSPNLRMPVESYPDLLADGNETDNIH